MVEALEDEPTAAGPTSSSIGAPDGASGSEAAASSACSAPPSAEGVGERACADSLSRLRAGAARVRRGSFAWRGPRDLPPRSRRSRPHSARGLSFGCSVKRAAASRCHSMTPTSISSSRGLLHASSPLSTCRRTRGGGRHESALARAPRARRTDRPAVGAERAPRSSSPAGCSASPPWAGWRTKHSSCANPCATEPRPGSPQGSCSCSVATCGARAVAWKSCRLASCWPGPRAAQPRLGKEHHALGSWSCWPGSRHFSSRRRAR